MDRTTPRKSVEILLVEDSEADIELTRQGLLDARICNHLHVAMDAAAALDFLFQRGSKSDAPRPDLVLLDLNLPGASGTEVLRLMKEDPMLREIPVVVLTTSSDARDVNGAYRLHANSFVTKPVRFSEFVEVVKELGGYWFDIVRLPASDAEHGI